MQIKRSSTATRPKMSSFFSVSSIWAPFSKEILLTLAALVFLAFSLFFLIWIRVTQLKSGYALAQLEAQQSSFQEQARALELEIAVLKRPERIRRIAIQELHLNMPSANQVVQDQRDLGEK